MFGNVLDVLQPALHISALTKATQQTISFLNYMKVYTTWPLAWIFPHSQLLPSDPG
jgi:hypothetical protein